MIENIVEMSDFTAHRKGKTKFVPQSTLRIEGKIVVEVLDVGEGGTGVVREMAKDDYRIINRKLFGPNCEFNTFDYIRLDWVPDIAVVLFDSSQIASVRAALPLAKRIERAGAMGLSFDLSDSPPSKMKQVSNVINPIGITDHSSTAEYLGAFLRGLLVPILTENFVGIEFSVGPLAFHAGHSSWAIAGQGQGENRAIGAIEDAMNRATAFGKNFDDADSVLMTIIVSPDFTMGESNAMARELDDSNFLGKVPFSYVTVVDDHRDETVEAILIVTE